jgi:WD40 repeat protein
VKDAERLDYSLLALPQHLHEAEDTQRLEKLLATFSFLDRKNHRFGPQAVVEDFDLTGLAALAVVRDAIRLAAHVVGPDGDQLAGQLIARLMDRPEDEVRGLVRQAQAQHCGPWLRPLAQTLPPPDGPLRRVLRGHRDCVFTVIVSPDGRFVISGGGGNISDMTRARDYAIRLWNVETGQLERVLDGHRDHVNALAVTLDGRLLISASSDDTLAVWDLASGLRQRVINVDGDGVHDLALTPDGGRVVSASENGRITLWSLRWGSEIRTMRGRHSSARAVAVTPDGRFAVSGSGDKTVRVWNLATGRLVRTLQGHSETVWSVAVSPDGRQVASGSGFIYGNSRDATVRLWDLATGAMTRIFEGHRSAVNSVAFSADGACLLSVSADGTLREWHCATGEELHSVRAATGHISTIVNAVAVLPGSGRAVTGSNDMTVKVWDLTRPALPDRYAHEDSVDCLLFTADGKHVISGASDPKVWDVETGQQRRLQADITGLHDMAVTPDGRRLLVVQGDGSVIVSDLDSGTTLLRLPGAPDGYIAPGRRRIAVTPDGLRFVVASDHDLKLRDASDGTVMASLPGLQGVNCLAVTADGRSFLAGGDDHRTRLWTPATSQELTLPRGKLPRAPKPETEAERLNRVDKERVVDVRVDAAGRRALALYAGGAVEVWNLRNLRSELVLYPHDEDVTSVFLTADGDTAVTSSQDRTVKVWDLTRNELVHRFEKHDGEVEDFAVHDRTALSVSDDDAQAILWDLDSGRVTGRFTADGPLASCAVSPDGETFALGELSGRLHFLRLSG